MHDHLSNGDIISIISTILTVFSILLAIYTFKVTQKKETKKRHDDFLISEIIKSVAFIRPRLLIHKNKIKEFVEAKTNESNFNKKQKEIAYEIYYNLFSLKEELQFDGTIFKDFLNDKENNKFNNLIHSLSKATESIDGFYANAKEIDKDITSDINGLYTEIFKRLK